MMDPIDSISAAPQNHSKPETLNEPKHRIELAIHKWQLTAVDQILPAEDQSCSHRPAAFRRLIERGASAFWADPSLADPCRLEHPPGKAAPGALSYFGLLVPASVSEAARTMITNGAATSKAHAYRILLSLGLEAADCARTGLPQSR